MREPSGSRSAGERWTADAAAVSAMGRVLRLQGKRPAGQWLATVAEAAGLELDLSATPSLASAAEQFSQRPVALSCHATVAEVLDHLAALGGFAWRIESGTLWVEFH